VSFCELPALNTQIIAYDAWQAVPDALEGSQCA
jgi:hypothetical protein